MKQVPDRKKQRREYLRKKRMVYVKAGLAAAFYVPLAAATVFFALGAIFSWIACMFWWDRAVNPGNRWDLLAVALTLMILIAGRLWYLSGLLYERSLQSVHDFDYVAPVTSDILPAEEVLVRGASEPSAPRETLLRAGVKSEETKAEELLRVASGSTGE